VRGSNGFFDLQWTLDGMMFYKTLWDLYETMAPKTETAEFEKEYRYDILTGELLGTFYCDAPMGDNETNIKPKYVENPTFTTTEKLKLEELEERVVRLENAVGIEHFYATSK
jgi:hypothetical protein